MQHRSSVDRNCSISLTPYITSCALPSQAEHQITPKRASKRQKKLVAPNYVALLCSQGYQKHRNTQQKRNLSWILQQLLTGARHHMVWSQVVLRTLTAMKVMGIERGNKTSAEPPRKISAQNIIRILQNLEIYCDQAA